MPNQIKTYQRDLLSSNLNWKVESRNLFSESGEKLPVLGNFRTDNGAFIGTVSDRYSIIQNEDVFRAVDSLRASGLSADFAYGDSMYNGTTVIKYDLPEMKSDIGGVGDMINGQLIITNNHGGRGYLKIALNVIRLVCTNGLIGSSRLQSTAIRHMGQSAFVAFDNAKHTVMQTAQDFKAVAAYFNALASVQVDSGFVGKVLERLFSKSESNNLYNNARSQAAASMIIKNFEENDNDQFREQRGTAYALMNGITRYADHDMRIRTKAEETAEQSKTRALLGVGYALKFAALQQIQNVMQSEKPSVNLPKLPVLQ